MTQDQHKLEPCPWCGGEAVPSCEFGFTRMHHYGRCKACGAHGPSFPEDEGGADAAASAWNTRAHLQQRPLPAREGTAEALQSLDAMVPAHLRSSRHGENFMGQHYEKVRAALLSPSLPVREEPTRWHELKTDPAVFDAMADGRKTCEIRFNDRNFKVGDGLLLRRTRDTGWAMKNTGAPLEYTGQQLRAVVTHITDNYGLHPDWVVLSIALASSPSVQNMGEGETGKDGVNVPLAPSKPHIYSLVFDYPGEETQAVGVTDRDDLIAKLREDVSDAGEPSMIEGIADQLLRDGVWHDEGGCIRLYAHGVNPSDGTQRSEGSDAA